MTSPPEVAFLLPRLGGGGVERVFGNYAGALAALGKRVDLVLLADTRRLVEPPAGVRVVNLAAPVRGDVTFPLALPALTRYLKRERPASIFAGMTTLNLLAILARTLARTKTQVLVSEHVPPSVNAKTHLLKRALPPLMRACYPHADAVVAVSQALAEDVARVARLPAGAVTTLYNPVVSELLLAEAKAGPQHPWFQGPEPVVVAIGRLHPQKDFPTLLAAFARLRQRRSAKLLILGEGEKRSALEAEVERLQLAEHVSLPGHVASPGSYLAHAALFVLSSRYEGFPTVLIEALACGCPVVSMDCPTGPREILVGGRYGRLVPPGDAAALAQAMWETLEAPLPRALLASRGRVFTVDAAVARLQELLVATAGRGAPRLSGARPGRSRR